MIATMLHSTVAVAAGQWHAQIVDENDRAPDPGSFDHDRWAREMLVAASVVAELQKRGPGVLGLTIFHPPDYST